MYDAWLLQLIVLVFIVCLTESGNGQQSRFNETGEYMLKKTLFDGYDTDIRPVKNGSTIQVKFEIALHQILGVDEKGESLAISVFVRIYWKDEFLVWKSEDYKNVTRIHVTSDKVWVPDITLANSIDREGDVRGNLDQVTKRVTINSDGNMTWFSNVILTSKCPMNIKYFPFDIQECKLTFSSWVYNGVQLDLLPNRGAVDTAAHSEHSEWHLESAEHKRFERKYACCPEPIPEIHVTIKLKRRPLFYVLNLILPIILIAFLTLLSFYVPSESGERISFGVTLLLAMTLFMLLLADMIPAASDNISLMEVFFTCVIIEMVGMIFLMCYIAKMYLRTPEEGRIPSWMRKYVYDYLAFKFGTRIHGTASCSGKFRRKNSYSLANGVDVEGVEMESNKPHHHDDEQHPNIEENHFHEELRTHKTTTTSADDSDSLNGGIDEVDEDKTLKQEEQSPSIIRKTSKKSKFQNMGLNVIKKNNEVRIEANKNQTDNNGHGDGLSRVKNKSIGNMEFDFADTVTQIMKQNNDTLLEKAREEKEEKLSKYEWKICAMTMDYIALIVFTFIFFLISICILGQ